MLQGCLKYKNKYLRPYVMHFSLLKKCNNISVNNLVKFMLNYSKIKNKENTAMSKCFQKYNNNTVERGTIYSPRETNT